MAVASFVPRRMDTTSRLEYLREDARLMVLPSPRPRDGVTGRVHANRPQQREHAYGKAAVYENVAAGAGNLHESVGQIGRVESQSQNHTRHGDCGDT